MEVASEFDRLAEPALRDRWRVGRAAKRGVVGSEVVQFHEISGVGYSQQRLVQLGRDGSGTVSDRPTRQKRRHQSEPVTSAQSVSNPSRYLKAVR